MKIRNMIFGLSMIWAGLAHAQWYNQDFELDSFLADSKVVWNGSTGSQHFTDGMLDMKYGWDTAWGGIWSSQWALSKSTYKTVEPSNFTNHLYSNVTGRGSSLSKRSKSNRAYMVGNNHSTIKTNVAYMSSAVISIDITNSLFAYNSMKFGDQFAKKFSHADNDSLILVISTYLVGTKTNEARVILADFRHADTTKNFILDSWQTVYFKNKANCDSMHFELLSSDNGDWGINTPAYFALDNISIDSPEDVQKIEALPLTIMPNPTAGKLNLVNVGSKLTSVKVYTVAGMEVKANFDQQTLDLSGLTSGLYLISAKNDRGQKLFAKVQKL